MKQLETLRLYLRAWKNTDAQKYFEINQDPKVIEFLPGSLTMEKVEKFLVDMNFRLQEYDYTFWAVEEKSSGELMGFCGFQAVSFEAPFSPTVEIGWRLGAQYWGKGYATEAAKACIDYGFEILKWSKIVSFTVPKNLRSQSVMKKIGMQFCGNFNHPKLEKNHPLYEHIWYEIEKK